jgi:hypothetical protein
LRFKATELWQKLPEYQGQDCPTWSEGWLHGFKSRHKIKSRRLFGESGAAQLGEECERIMADIREAARGYDARDVYNMDETGFNWRTVPEISLGTTQHKGGKKDKARITAVMCCNAMGTDRVPIWYIGKAARPTCFRTARIERLDGLGAKWRSNPTAWIDHKIIIEWLRWFDSRVNRPVLLLIDNFLAHELGLRIIEEADGLRFTTVKWLPPNATLIY